MTIIILNQIIFSYNINKMNFQDGISFYKLIWVKFIIFLSTIIEDHDIPIIFGCN